jgi:hypothetical protein
VAAGNLLPDCAHDFVNRRRGFRNVARSLGKAVKLHLAGKFEAPDRGLRDPIPK